MILTPEKIGRGNFSCEGASSRYRPLQRHLHRTAFGAVQVSAMSGTRVSDTPPTRVADACSSFVLRNNSQSTNPCPKFGIIVPNIIFKSRRITRRTPAKRLGEAASSRYRPLQRYESLENYQRNPRFPRPIHYSPFSTHHLLSPTPPSFFFPLSFVFLCVRCV